MIGERARLRLLGLLLAALLLGAQVALLRRASSIPVAALLLVLAAGVALALVRSVRASAARREEAREARLAETLRVARRMRQEPVGAGQPIEDHVR